MPSSIPASSHIQDLADNEVFVFGSNLDGIHGAGAALLARRKFGATTGTGRGITGQCYALPTRVNTSTGFRTLSLAAIEHEVRVFNECARNHPDKVFLVTQVGCGLAGLGVSDIAPLFAASPDNVRLPKAFLAELARRNDTV